MQGHTTSRLPGELKERRAVNGNQVVQRQRPVHLQEYCSEILGEAFRVVSGLYNFCYGPVSSFFLMGVGM